jgi:regulatory protein
MIVTSIEQHTKTKVKVCLDNRTDFQLYKREIDKYGINEGEELSNYDEILSEVLIPRAKKRAMHLLEKMDRTKADIRSKLRRNGYPDEAINAAIEYIESYNYLNDERYAYMYVRNYCNSRSRNRIMQDLYRKGVDKDTINDAIESEYTVDEEELINMYIIKRGYDSDNASMKDRDKMFRFLISKGFPLDEIQRLI